MALAPGVYSRNRHFELYRRADLGPLRRRASELRGIARQLAMPHVRDITICELAGGGIELSFVVPNVALRRTSTLSRLELAVVRVVLARSGVSSAPATSEDQVMVRTALATLPGFVVGPNDAPPELRADESRVREG